MRVKQLTKPIIWAALLLVFASACTSVIPAAPTATVVPTIALPTATVRPADTATATPTPPPTATSTPTLTPTPAPAVLIGAGDIAYCGDGPEFQGDEKTSNLIETLIARQPGAAIFTAGDTVYGDGTMTELKKCFDPSWGRFKDRIRPAPGNHDYMTDNGAPYFTYFGEAAGPDHLGYYSYDLGSWHIVSLDSVCDQVQCGNDSPQVQWLREDLQRSGSKCTLVYWHHPRWSSGIAGGSGNLSRIWRTVVENGVEVVVNGHDHDYERFAPMDGDGNPDPNGAREFVVGTGGAQLRIFDKIKPNSEVRYSGLYGVIQFRLYPDRYEWEFLPVGDSAKTDSGSGECH